MTTISAVASAILLSTVAGGVDVPGLTVVEYARDLERPWQMSFDPNTRALYVGRNGPGVVSFRVYRIGAGGDPVQEYGDEPLPDPDAVLFDAFGRIAAAGSVLVGSGVTDTTGQLAAILPDETIEIILAPSEAMENPADMAFDSTGRLVLLIDNDSQDASTILVSDGGPAVPLVSIDERCLNLAVGPEDAIYVASLAGSIIKFSSLGTRDPSFAISDLGSRPPVYFSNGGPLGADLYTVNKNTGELLRVDDVGQATSIGTGFDGGAADIASDDVGSLYITMESEGRILRITCRADLDGSGAVDFGDVLAILSAWSHVGGPEDLDGSGTVDFGDLLVVLGNWGRCAP